MDPVLNPYAPGAGTRPPALAGRDRLRENARIALARIKAGRAAKSVLLIGLRGAGKTVLLDRMREDAEAEGYQTMRVEAPEARSLPALLAPDLRLALIKLSRKEQAKQLVDRALSGLAGFVGAFKLKYDDIEMGMSYQPEPGLADNGDLEHDLQALFEVVGEAAQGVGTALVMFIDELQYVEEDQLAALITALHRTAQRQLPVTLIGAGLPQLPGRMGRAKSYAERLFEFNEIGPLPDEDAAAAIELPAQEHDVSFDPEAVAEVLRLTQGYPYFLQEWGKHCWDAAERSPITRSDVEIASEAALAALDASFFRVRFDRLTPTEKRYLRAMAALGPGPHRSGDIAQALQREVQSVAPTRSNLIKKGMLWSPSHGDTAFTVPMFDEYLKRIMPDDSGRP